MRMVKSSANFLLKNADDDPETPTPRVGGNWVRRFANRRPEVYRKRQRVQELHNKETIGAWHDMLADVIRNNGMLVSTPIDC